MYAKKVHSHDGMLVCVQYMTKTDTLPPRMNSQLLCIQAYTNTLKNIEICAAICAASQQHMNHSPV
jgi:hypothetical protein